MPDIQMRFDKDMLVLSSPLEAVLARQGVDVQADLEYLVLIEPDALRDTVRMEKVAGAQCLVAATEGIAPARLAHKGMDGREADFARAALDLLRPLKPQHLLAEIGPCGLPLDGSSADSLNENRSQYARAAHAFDGQEIDALLLTGFEVRADGRTPSNRCSRVCLCEGGWSGHARRRPHPGGGCRRHHGGIWCAGRRFRMRCSN